jgi:hypothetical protein
LDAVELQFWPRHLEAKGTADGATMREKSEVLLDIAILSNGVVEQKSVVIAR